MYCLCTVKNLWHSRNIYYSIIVCLSQILYCLSAAMCLFYWNCLPVRPTDSIECSSFYQRVLHSASSALQSITKWLKPQYFTIMLSKWVFTVIQIYAQWILMIFMYCPWYGNVVYKRYHLQFLRKMCRRRALASAVLLFFCHKPFWETVVSCLNEGPIAPSFFGM